VGEEEADEGREHEAAHAGAREDEAHGGAAVGGEVLGGDAQDGEVEEGGADPVEEALGKEEVPYLNRRSACKFSKEKYSKCAYDNSKLMLYPQV
jgi:hypothetical protein